MQQDLNDTFFTLQAFRSPEAMDNPETPAPPATPISRPPESPECLASADSQHDWINEIQSYDLLDFENMEKKDGQSSSFLPAGNMDFSSIQYESAFIVAPSSLLPLAVPVAIKSEPLDTPTGPVQNKRGRKPRKDSHVFLSNESPEPSLSYESHRANLECEDIKPTIGRARLAGRKRPSSSNSNGNSTITSASQSKKPKKYELDPSTDPGAKNALAAFLNREKKKSDTNILKAENEELKQTNISLSAQLEIERREKEILRQERDEERERNLATNGLRGVAGNIRDFLISTVPALQENHGPFAVTLSEFFSEVALNDAQMRPELLRGPLSGTEHPSEYFTAHVNMNERRMLIDYDPHMGGM